MEKFTRAKRVSDPLNERVRAQLLHSAHHEHDSNDSSSSSFSFTPTLIHGFFDLDNDTELPTNNSNDCSTTSDSNDDDFTNRAAVEALQDLLDPSSDPLRTRLHSDVIMVADALSSLRSAGSDKHRQAVMARLRDIGYNAGVCKAKWESSGGLTAGSYEFIDVLLVVNNDHQEIERRFIVDLDFKAQFEVARATEEYETVVRLVPSVLVGKEEEVRKVVRVMAAAAKRSMTRREISVPPWRKRRYLLSKWFGPYKRIMVNPCNSLASSCVYNGGGNIKCPSVVGFTADVATRKWTVS